MKPRKTSAQRHVDSHKGGRLSRLEDRKEYRKMKRERDLDRRDAKKDDKMEEMRNEEKEDIKWIQKAVKKPGALRAKAKAAGAIKKDGNISKTWMEKKLKSPKTSTTTKRQINLAKTLSKQRRK